MGSLNMPRIKKTLRQFGLKRSAMFAKGAVSIMSPCLNCLPLIRPRLSTPWLVPGGLLGPMPHRLG
jgi:hypothetical protein